MRGSAAHCGRRDVVRVVQVACDQVAEPPLISVDQCIFIEYVLYGAGEQRHGFHQLAQPLFDALGDDNFAFPGEQFNSAHFSHVHPHRVCGAAGLVFDCSQRGCCFSRCHFVSAIIAVVFIQNQRIGVRCGLKHLDTHVVDHLDDVFNLIRIRDGIRQVVIDL